MGPRGRSEAPGRPTGEPQGAQAHPGEARAQAPQPARSGVQRSSRVRGELGGGAHPSRPAQGSEVTRLHPIPPPSLPPPPAAIFCRPPAGGAEEGSRGRGGPGPSRRDPTPPFPSLPLPFPLLSFPPLPSPAGCAAPSHAPGPLEGGRAATRGHQSASRGRAVPGRALEGPHPGAWDPHRPQHPPQPGRREGGGGRGGGRGRGGEKVAAAPGPNSIAEGTRDLRPGERMRPSRDWAQNVRGGRRVGIKINAHYFKIKIKKQ